MNKLHDTRPWPEIARPNQLMPPGNWNVWLLLAGRGFGKTRSAAEAIQQLVSSEYGYKRIALIANTIQEAKQVMVEGESGLLATARDDNPLIFQTSKRLLTWKNGAIATIYGAENYEQLRGPQFDAAWIDELAKFQYPRETFEQLSFSLRLGQHPRTIITTTPRPIQFIKDLMSREDVATVRGTSLENIANLSPTFLRQLEYLKGTRLEAQEIYAEIIEENKDTLWAWRDIECCYATPPHFLPRVIIGVDPAITSNENSDETGIVVVGMDGYNKAYVLDDLSTIAKPEIWAEKVAQAYAKYSAQLVVIERNAGGDLLVNLLQSTSVPMKIKTVYARTSKIARAEPIVVLYQKHIIHHARQFHELEMQMATFTPHTEKSPDRLDAMVWAMKELFSIDDSTKMPGVFIA